MSDRRFLRLGFEHVPPPRLLERAVELRDLMTRRRTVRMFSPAPVRAR